MTDSGPAGAEPNIWRNRPFVLLFVAQVISLVGSGATTIGLALFAYQMAGARSATIVVGNALTLRIVAFLLFSQPAGILADRLDRKRILIASDVIRAALLSFLPFATAVWQVYVLIFSINAVTAFFTPTYEATIPAIVGEAQVVKALSVSRVAVDVEAIAAPGVAAVIVALVGARWVFWFDAGTYLVSAALVLIAAIPKSAFSRTELVFRKILGEISFGTKAILREPSLRHALVLSLVEAVAGAVAIVATVAYVRDTLGRGEMSVTIAMAAVGGGSSAAALALGSVTARREGRVAEGSPLHSLRHRWAGKALRVGGLLLGAVLVVGKLVPPFAVFVALWALNGAGQALIAISSSTLLAEHTIEEERGRVYAAHFALTHACWLVTYPAVGHAVAAWGTPTTMTAAGTCCLIVTLLAQRWLPPATLHQHQRSTS